MAATIKQYPLKTDFSDQDLTNVGSVALDEITSDSATSVTVTLGGDAGDDFIVGPSNKFVVEGESGGNIGIGTATPSSTVEIEGSSGDLILEIDNNVSNSANFQIQNGAGNARVDLVMNDGTSNTTITMKGQKVGIGDTSPSYGLDVNGTARVVGAATFDSNISSDGSVTLKEKAAAIADVAAYGQLWVKTATPNELYFTDDAGNDVQLVTGGAAAGGGGGYTAVTDITSAGGLTASTYHIVDTNAGSAAFTVTLPAASAVAAGTQIGVKATHAATYAVTISRAAGGNIDGAAANIVLSSNMAAVELISDATDWWIMS